MSCCFNSGPAPNSLDLGHLIEIQLQKAQQELPDHRIQTLDDVRSMVGKLSEITNICVDYIDHIQDKLAAQAFQEMEYGFEWSKCKHSPLIERGFR
jgi:hypothetical protein